MAEWTAPTASDFKALFVRDFPYAPESDADNADYIMDSDIDSAIADALVNFNSDLDDADHRVFLTLAAYWLVENIKLSSKGLSSQAKFLESSKSVGGVSVGYSIPDKFAKNPVLAGYMRNGYGQKYLSMILPYIVGNVDMQSGTTT
jgi:hypothetical protein